MRLLPFAIAWAVLATVVIALAIYRRVVAGQEDDTLHVSDVSSSITAHQIELAKKLESIDRWGKLLTVVTIVYGLAVAAAYMYVGWIEGSQYRG